MANILTATQAAHLVANVKKLSDEELAHELEVARAGYQLVKESKRNAGRLRMQRVVGSLFYEQERRAGRVCKWCAESPEAHDAPVNSRDCTTFEPMPTA